MKKFTLLLCILIPILSKAQLYIAGDANLYVSGSTGLYCGEQLTNYGLLTTNSTDTVTLNAITATGIISYTSASPWDTGYINCSSTSNLTIVGPNTGTYIFYNIYFDQTTLGTTNVLKNLTINGNASLATKNYLDIIGGANPGTVTVGSNSLLYTNGNLNLKSDANGTASIGISGGVINNNITVERYIPANGRRYRFLASPVVGGTTLEWRNNNSSSLIVGKGIQITGGSNSALYDVSTKPAASAFYYLETNTTGSIHDPAKWIAIDGNTNLTNGKGYRVFVRGDRTISLTTLNTTNNATTIWVNGTYPAGTITLPVTYTNATGGGLGWNLVGNPYPCNIDWMSASGWTKTNVGTGVAIWRPSTNSYAYSLANSDASGGLPVAVNGGGTVIGSGQGFFVRATGSSPALSCTENVKVLTAPTTLLLKTTPSNQLRIKLTQDSINIDETVIVFGSKFQDEFIESEDFSKIPNPTVNISSVVGVEQYAAINFTSNNYVEKIIPLSVWGDINGTYQLNLTQVSGFDASVSIFLRDKYLKTTTAIDQDKTININLADNSKGDNRFELLFKNSATNTEDVLISNTQIAVFPNPVTDELNINLNNANFKNSNVIISNVSGQQIMNTNMNGANAKINIEGLSNGVYFVTITNENGFNQTVKFVK